MYFFFFKQKTAYEMRISDWSSDVCSSDRTRGSVTTRVFGRILQQEVAHRRAQREQIERLQFSRRLAKRGVGEQALWHRPLWHGAAGRQQQHATDRDQRFHGRPLGTATTGLIATVRPRARSEEHTSELQSLMRISYAFFCLYK